MKYSDLTSEEARELVGQMDRRELENFTVDLLETLKIKDRQIERLADIGSAAMGDGGIVDKYQQERNQALANLERVGTLINNAFGEALALVEEVDQQIYETQQYLESSAIEGQHHAIVWRLIGLYNAVERMDVEIHNGNIQQLATIAPKADARENPAAILAALNSTLQVVGRQRCALAITHYAIGLSSDPPMICSAITFILKGYDPESEPEIRSRLRWLLDRLQDSGWLKEFRKQQPETPKKIEVIQEHLESAARVSNSGLTIEEFANKYGENQRVLYRHNKLLSALTEVAHQVPPNIRNMVEVGESQRE